VAGTSPMEQQWVVSTSVVHCEIGYVETVPTRSRRARRRARRLTTAGLRTARGAVDGLWDQLDVVPVTTVLIRQAADLAEAEGLRGYDAVHLAAALLVPVATVASSDSRLCEAAARHGLNVSSAG
jgi:uncharacterized protein